MQDLAFGTKYFVLGIKYLLGGTDTYQVLGSGSLRIDINSERWCSGREGEACGAGVGWH